MSIKPHKPLRTFGTNAFNKNKFKGNYEKITDADLDTELWICEPATLADLPETADKFLYQQAWTRWENGGRIFISLVPYRERPKIKVKVTSRAGDFLGLERDDIISAFTNVELGVRPTKRFYLNKDPATLKLDEFKRIDFEQNPGLVVYEENNYVEIINNDDTVKQWGLTLGRVVFYDGGDNSFYRNITFFWDQQAWVNANEIGFTSYSHGWLGHLEVKDNTNKTAEVDYSGRINRHKPAGSNGYIIRTTFDTITSDNKLGSLKRSDLSAHFVIPMASGSRPKWKVPWVWEYLYIKAQFSGKYSWIGIQDATNTNNIPNNSVKESNTWDGIKPTYKEIKSKSFLETNAKKLLHYFLGYTVEFGLPQGLSSHNATYFESQDDEGVKGRFGLSYNYAGLNGARPTTAEGVWSGNNSIFVVDNAYDPTVLIAVAGIKLYLSDIKYGAYYGSPAYEDLIINILNGDPVYGGTSFNSNMSVLEDIETVSTSDDIRTWNNDKEWNLYIMNKDIIDMSNDIDGEIIEAPSYPKLKSWVLDFTPFAIRTNYTRPFNNLLLKDEIFTQQTGDQDIPDETFGVRGKIDSNGVGEITVNGRFETDISIQLYKDEQPTYWLRIPSDVKEGRSLSGGTMFTFL